VVFLNTATDEFRDSDREGLVRCVRGGSAFVGIHSASYFQKDWPWYEALVGARFAGHPEPQIGRVEVTDRDHPATKEIPASWSHMDEWYNFRSIPAGVRVLATVDESTYAGGAHSAHHPVVWCHTYEGSRSLYTALGHTEECFRDELYLRHILGAIRWAAGLAG
jgi:type 1 glutamine amidotransferase